MYRHTAGNSRLRRYRRCSTSSYTCPSGLLGEAVVRAGRWDEAEALAEASRQAAAPDDIYSQVV